MGKIKSKQKSILVSRGYGCCTHFVLFVFAFFQRSFVLELSLCVFQGMKQEMYAYILQRNSTERDWLKGRKITGANIAALWCIRG